MVIGLFGLIIAMVVNIFLGSAVVCNFGWRRSDFCRSDSLGYAAYQIHVSGR